MNSELASWERKHYVVDGGEPLLFYVVYGDIEPTAPLSRSTYRSSGTPDGIDVWSYGPEQRPEVVNSFREGYLWDQFLARSPELASRVQQCEQCLLIRGTPSDFSTLNYLRDTVGLISYLIDQGGCAIYDPQMFRWWEPSEWKQELFAPAGPVPRNHTVILFSAEEDNAALTWYHTRGMRKFGRPDISVHNVPAELENGVIDLCNRLIEYQAFGHVVPEGQPINMQALPCGGTIHHGGDFDDPDFNNVHIEVKLNL